MSVYSFVGKEEQVKQVELEKELVELVEQTQNSLTGFAKEAQYWVIE